MSVSTVRAKSREKSPKSSKKESPKQPSQTAPTAPETLRDCLAPLAAAALSTSLLTYQWGREKGTLMRASAVMDFCGNIIEQANRLLAHEESAESTARACAAQRAAGVAGGGGGGAK